LKERKLPEHKRATLAPAPPREALALPMNVEAARVDATPAAPPLVQHVMRQWRIVAAVTIACTLAAWLFAAMQPKRYHAVAIAAITPVAEGLSSTDVLRSVDTLERRTLVATIAALAVTPLTHRSAVPPHAHGYDIDAVVMPNTNLVRVTVDGEDPKIAAEVANRVPAVIGPQARALYRFYHVTMVSAATPPEQSAFPRVGRTVAAGLIVGLILGGLTAWLLETRRFRFAQ